jgi:hypothetical protein
VQFIVSNVMGPLLVAADDARFLTSLPSKRAPLRGAGARGHRWELNYRARPVSNNLKYEVIN